MCSHNRIFETKSFHWSKVVLAYDEAHDWDLRARESIGAIKNWLRPWKQKIVMENWDWGTGRKIKRRNSSIFEIIVRKIRVILKQQESWTWRKWLWDSKSEKNIA